MMTWGDIYKQFKQEYPKAEATDYRPYVEGYICTDDEQIRAAYRKYAA